MKNVKLNQKLVEDINERDNALAGIVKKWKTEAMLSSDIFNLGTTFEYMQSETDAYQTIKMSSSLFENTITNVENYTQEKYNKSYYKELLDAGMIFVKPFKLSESYNAQTHELTLKIVKSSVCNSSIELNSTEFDETLGNTIVQNDSSKSINVNIVIGDQNTVMNNKKSSVSNNSIELNSTEFDETLGNTIVLKNVENAKYVRPHFHVKFKGQTNPVIFTNTGIWLFSLRAVIKLGMFMTGTEKARLFRDKIIDQLALGQVAQETADEYFEAIFDKDHIKLYANDTEKLLEMLDRSYKYDLMKGVITKSVDPMKRKVKMIDARKAEFEKDIQGYQQQIDAYVNIDEDLFFDKIETLKTKISETDRIIAALDGVFRTLTLRLRAVDVVVNKMSLKSGSASNNMDGVKATITKIRKIIAEDRPVPPELQGSFDVRKMNKLLRDELGLIDTEGVYAIVTDSKGNEKELTGHVIEDAWVERYTEEFINSIQSGQERNGNSSCKFIKWSEFGMRFISLLFYKHYVENWTETDFFKLTEDDWKKLVYDGYIEEKMREYNSL